MRRALAMFMIYVELDLLFMGPKLDSLELPVSLPVVEAWAGSLRFLTKRSYAFPSLSLLPIA